MKKFRKTAFTLIELLVVISVISVLMGILMPVLVRARQQGKDVVCLNNLRQMVMAASIYTTDNNGRYPLAYSNYLDFATLTSVESCWDFTVKINWSTSPETVEIKPGLLWNGTGSGKVQQCPSFKGKSNTAHDPFTGYNYNTSYIGHDGENPAQSAKVTEIMTPALTVIFGDGQWAEGANKFMRAPWPNPRDTSLGGAQWAGTQGYRHCGKTNVAFCDGHVESRSECYKETLPEGLDKIAEGTGFLSPDNSLYDLK